jgi:hypothetical protein
MLSLRGGRFFRQVLHALLFVSCVRVGAVAQESLPVHSPEDAVRILQSGKAEEKARLAKQFHLDGDLTGMEFSVIYRPLDAGRKTAVITARLFDVITVIVLKHTRQGWLYEDSLPFWAWTDKLSMNLKPLTEPPLNDIVIHQHVTTHGTGLYEAHFVVVKLIDSRLRIVLDTVEEAHISGWPRDEGDIEQKSVFKLTPAKKDEPADIEEEETVRTGSFAEVRKRDFTWIPEFKIFEPSEWSSAQTKKLRNDANP